MTIVRLPTLGALTTRSIARLFGALLAAIMITVPLALWIAPQGHAEKNLSVGGGKIADGFYVGFGGDTSTDIGWNDITVILAISSGQSNAVASWYNISQADLISQGHPRIWHFGSPKQLGGFEVWLNVTDSLGDGRLSSGDRLNFTSGGTPFNNTTTLSLTMMDDTLDSPIFSMEYLDPTAGPVFVPSLPSSLPPESHLAYELTIAAGALLMGLVLIDILTDSRRARSRQP